MPTLLLVRPENRHAADIALCQQHGWTALPFAPIRIVPHPTECNHLPQQYAHADASFWVSPTAVEIAAPYLSTALKSSLKPHIAVGKSTATTLHNIGAQNIHHDHTGNDSEAALQLPIWRTLPYAAHILIIRGQNGREYLPETLRQHNFHVYTADIYHREPQLLDWTHFQAALPDAAWVTSSEIAQQLFAQAPLPISQKLKSLLYFTHHARIANTLHQLGASRIRVISQLDEAFYSYPKAA